MYTIIGGDGREYGPVSAEQVRGWIAAGRANSLTKIRPAGSEEWRTVAEFPELTSAPAAARLTAVSEGTVKLDIISCYERGWALVKSRFWSFVGAAVVMVAIYCFIAYLQRQGIFYLNIIVNAPLSAGLSYYFLRHIRGEPAGLGDLFAGFRRTVGTLILVGLVSLVGIVAGIFLLILPGIYIAVAWSFAPILALDKGLGFWEAMETSRRVATRNWWRIFGLFLLGIPFLLLGVAALGVGVFVALPLIWAACMYAYEDLFSSKR